MCGKYFIYFLWNSLLLIVALYFQVVWMACADHQQLYFAQGHIQDYWYDFRIHVPLQLNIYETWQVNIGTGNGFGAIRQQAITWVNVNPDTCICLHTLVHIEL